MPKADTQFKKGKSGNPQGRPKSPEDVIKAKKLSSDEFIRIANRFFYMTRDQIAEELKKPGATILEMIVGGIAVRAAKDNDYQRATFLLDRVIGKVTESVEVKLPRPTIIKNIETGEEITLSATLEGTEDA